LRQKRVTDIPEKHNPADIDDRASSDAAGGAEEAGFETRQGTLRDRESTLRPGDDTLRHIEPEAAPR
jgi:hypothetical protein